MTNRLSDDAVLLAIICAWSAFAAIIWLAQIADWVRHGAEEDPWETLLKQLR